MKILLIHQNFPGQFQRLAPALVERGHDVVAITDSGNKNKTTIKTLGYKFDKTEPNREETRLGRSYTQTSDRGVMVGRACKRLRETHGYMPHVVFGHSGWGEMLFVKSVWPEAKVISYAEYYYSDLKGIVGFDPEFDVYNFDQVLIGRSRAAHMAHSLIHSDAGISPTYWQASTHPEVLKKMITVIHEGVDTDVMKPNPEASVTLESGTELRAGDEVLTFINRNLEPYRGYHTFMRALPEILRARPNAHVLIIGGDEVSYGPPPKDKKGWKEVFIDEIKEQTDMSRVHFMGKVSYDTFVKVMQISRTHAYLTYPFVLSWSMLEAMAACCLVVGSKTQPVEEVIRDGENGLLVDFFDIKEWSRVLIDTLANPEKYQEIRQAARRTILESYDFKTICLPQMVEFLESFGPRAKKDTPKT